MKLAALALAAALTPALAGAQQFEAAQNATFALDLDSNEGVYSEWTAQDLRGIDAVRARAALRRFGEHERWVPAGSFELTRSDVTVTLQVWRPREGAALELALIRRRGTQEGRDVREVFETTLAPGEEFDLEIDWDPAGRATFRVRTSATVAAGGDGFETHAMSLGGAPERFRVIASTGELTVPELALGRWSVAPTPNDSGAVPPAR